MPALDSGELLEAGLQLIHTASKGALGEATAREFVNRVLKASGQEAVQGETVATFFDNWLQGKELSKSTHTAQRYKTTVELFKQSMGKRANAALAGVTARDVEAFRNFRLKEVSASTVSIDLKVLRGIFNAARRQGLVHANPVETVDMPKGESQAREAFSIPEVRLLLAATTDQEWKTTILLGFYAGMRLGDAVGLKWESIDLKEGLLRYRATKTKRKEETPIHPILQRHLEGIAGNATGAVSPTLARQIIPGRSGLSRQFLDIVKAAGIDAMQGKKGKGKRRSFTGKSFHSLRHGFISAMANAGIAPELRQKLSGHSTADIHRKYTHLELDPLRQAIASIGE